MELGMNYLKALEIAQAEQWDVDTLTADGDYVIFSFQQFSRAGGDMSFDVWIKKEDVVDDNISSLINGIYDYWNDYDVDYNVYIWLDDTGHPCNGAPNSISALVHDVEEWISWVRQLYEKLDLNF